MKYTYQTSGTCCKQIEIQIENGLIEEVKFLGGCNGNLQGIASLIRGMRPADVAQRLANIRCGSKQTSCPHQLSKALANLPQE